MMIPSIGDDSFDANSIGVGIETPGHGPLSGGQRPIRVVLADDHTLVRQGMHLALQSTSDIQVVGEACDGEGAIDLVRALDADVLVLDLTMPGMDGMAVLRALGDAHATVRVLVVTMHSQEQNGLETLRIGARGFLTKDASAGELVHAIREVAADHVYVRADALHADDGDSARLNPARQRFALLSKREQSVVRMVAEGFSGVEIAAHLGISTKTVDAYKQRAQDKLGITHRTEYVQFAVHAGLLADASRQA
ncbi:MAG TPA: response regulator transcription factor [Gemmatimonas sp.]|nr:response regulator transcription factor [Gemmatimonas sp.]